MGTVYEEDNEWEGVSKYEFSDAGDAHGDTAKEVEAAADAGEGCRATSLEL